MHWAFPGKCAALGSLLLPVFIGLGWLQSSHSHDVLMKQNLHHLSLKLQPTPSRSSAFGSDAVLFLPRPNAATLGQLILPREEAKRPESRPYLCLRCLSLLVHLPIPTQQSKTQFNHHLCKAFSDSITLNSHFTPDRISCLSFWVPTKPYSYFSKLGTHIVQFWKTKVQHLFDKE